MADSPSLLARLAAYVDPTPPIDTRANNVADLDQLDDYSTEVATAFGKPDLGEPPIEEYGAPRPAIDEAIETPAKRAAAPGRLLGSPVPTFTTVFRGVPAVAGPAAPVQVVPPAGGRPRSIKLRNTSLFSADIYLYTEDAGGYVAATTPPPGGYTLRAGDEFETSTQGPIYVAAGFPWLCCAWVDYYASPVDDDLA